MNESVVMVDRAGVIRFWSNGAVAKFGWTADQAMGETLDLIVPAEYREAHWGGFRRAVESGSANVDGNVTQFPATCADGVVREISGRVMLARDPRGQVNAVVVVFEGELS